jgi:hypothetical protein
MIAPAWVVCYLTFNTLSAKDAREATIGETQGETEVPNV